MTSRIYAGGNRATAIANIKADINATCFHTSRGRKVLDMQALYSYIQTKLLNLAADEGLTSAQAAAVNDAAQRTSPYPIGNQLQSTIGLGVIQQRSDYPAGTASPAVLAANIAQAKAKTESIAASLTADFSWTQDDRLKEFVKSYYNEVGKDSDVPAGVTRIIETRAYRYAYRSDIGEISKPSDASGLADVDQNDTVTVVASAPPAGRFVDSVLWYRSATGNASASWLFAGEKTVASGLSFTDTVKNEALGEVLPSVEWDEPPANLRGLRMHPGNFGIGFFDNTICPSVANRLYAWPITWRKTTVRPIVGLEIGGTSIFVGTMGEPYLLTGSDPAFLSAERVRGGEPCRSARSIVATHRGFMYAGARGIALCSGIDDTPVLTEGIFTKAQWDALNPESIQAVEHDGCYIFLWSNGLTSGCYSFGIDTGRLSTLDLSASALFKNPANGKLYAVSGTQIVEVFGGASPRLGLWRSPRVAVGGRGGFAYRKVTSDFEAGPVTVRWNRWFEDGSSDQLTYSATTKQPARVHRGKPEEYEIEVQSQSAVTELRMCSNSEELQR